VGAGARQRRAGEGADSRPPRWARAHVNGGLVRGRIRGRRGGRGAHVNGGLVRGWIRGRRGGRGAHVNGGLVRGRVEVWAAARRRSTCWRGRLSRRRCGFVPVGRLVAGPGNVMCALVVFRSPCPAEAGREERCGCAGRQVPRFGARAARADRDRRHPPPLPAAVDVRRRPPTATDLSDVRRKPSPRRYVCPAGAGAGAGFAHCASARSPVPSSASGVGTKGLSRRYHSASSAATHPDPAAVTAWR